MITLPSGFAFEDFNNGYYESVTRVTKNVPDTVKILYGISFVPIFCFLGNGGIGL
jgi:hypothetical protein